jgi:hypothetical protein
LKKEEIDMIIKQLEEFRKKAEQAEHDGMIYTENKNLEKSMMDYKPISPRYAERLEPIEANAYYNGVLETINFVLKVLTKELEDKEEK